MTNKNYSQIVRDAADSAVCEFFERFTDVEIRDAVADVERDVLFEAEGKQYVARFYLPGDDLWDCETADDLANAVIRAIRDMPVEIEEAEPEDECPDEPAPDNESEVDAYVLVSDADMSESGNVFLSMTEAVAAAEEIAQSTGETVTIHESTDFGEHYFPRPCRTVAPI